MNDRDAELILGAMRERARGVLETLRDFPAHPEAIRAWASQYGLDDVWFVATAVEIMPTGPPTLPSGRPACSGAQLSRSLPQAVPTCQNRAPVPRRCSQFALTNRSRGGWNARR